jgi:hypothetical protein
MKRNRGVRPPARCLDQLDFIDDVYENRQYARWSNALLLRSALDAATRATWMVERLGCESVHH